MQSLNAHLLEWWLAADFFGEIAMWWGIWLSGCSVFRHSGPGYATVISPLFTMWAILLLSGIPTAEGENAKRWFDGGEGQENYEQYFASTSPLIPLPPTCYRLVPICVKRIFCFELPSYEYRPESDESAYLRQEDGWSRTYGAAPHEAQ